MPVNAVPRPNVSPTSKRCGPICGRSAFARRWSPAAVLETTWRAPLACQVVLEDEVQVWRAWLDQSASRVQELARLLSSDERQRAEQSYFERDRVRFIVGRGLLRTILGRCLGMKPPD